MRYNINNKVVVISNNEFKVNKSSEKIYNNKEIQNDLKINLINEKLNCISYGFNKKQINKT